MKQNIIIRTDGDNKIGLGHIYRSLYLAKELKKNKFNVIFLSKNIFLKKIIPKNFQVEIFDGNLKKLEKILQQLNPKLIIVDKLKESSIQLQILSKYSTLVGIDYIGKNNSKINYGINILYQKSGIIRSNSFSGFNLSILNNSITNYKPIKINKKVNHILIIQGGSDTPCNTPTILNALNKIDSDFEINIIVGGAFECWNKLYKTIDSSKHLVKLHSNVKNIGKIMIQNDIAITGGGITSLELCSLGIPSIIICGSIYENETSSLLEKYGSAINLGYKKNFRVDDITETVKKLLDNYEQRKEMNKVGKNLIDEKGSKRVVEIILRINK